MVRIIYNVCLAKKKGERGVSVCVRFAEKKKQEDKQMGRQNKGLERERVTRDN